MTSVRAGRATLNALAACLAAAFGLVLWGGLIAVCGAAIASIVGGPGGWGHAVLYVLVVLATPVLLLWAIQGLAEVQRARVSAVLRVDIIRPTTRHASWPIGPWRSGATWRALAYHGMALVIGGVGGALVLACWLSPVLATAWVIGGHSSYRQIALALSVALGLVIAAPHLARWVAARDASVARTLLGPSRSDELAMQVESLARSRADIVEATDAERRRIERDLHDGAQQRLVSLAMNLGIARANLVHVPEPARRAIADAHDEAVLALSEMRAFIRGLHPAVLDDRGLDAALSGLVAHAPLPVRLTVDVRDRTSPSVEAVAYFIVSEALTNVAKYADATRAEVTVVRTGDLLHIAVTDDGRGGAAPTGDGTGLRGLAQRAASVDGTLTIDSPPGGPTTIVAELPCES